MQELRCHARNAVTGRKKEEEEQVTKSKNSVDILRGELRGKEGSAEPRAQAPLGLRPA